jgi:predicted transcriptional regulator
MEKGLEVLKTLAFTPSKLKILESLKTKRDLSEISESLGKAKQTVVPHLRTLIDLGLIEKDGERYKLSKMGEVTYKKFSEDVRFFDVIGNLKEFLKEHDVSPIPDSLLSKIHMLYGGEVFIKDNPYEFHQEWLNILLKSSWIYGLASIYHKEFPKLFNELSKKKEVKLIITEDIFERVRRLNEKELNKFLRRGEMFVCKNVKLTFVVAEKGFTMNLYRDSYDASQILICKTKDAVEWGMELFKHYLAQSRKIES